jgi:phage/plasmid-associated DNA primase
MICANRVLQNIEDNSDSMLRRLVPFYWHRRIPDSEVIPSLSDDLRGEAPAIFNWALVGAKSLYERGDFLLPESSIQLLDTFRGSSSRFADFADDMLESEKDGQVPIAKLHLKYLEWCKENDDEPCGIGEFKMEIANAIDGSKVVRTRPKKGKRIWVLRNVKLK